MTAMRVAKGRVVGNTVVLDDDAHLPEGAAVEVTLDDDGNGVCDVTPEEWAKLKAAMASLDRGEGIDAEDFFAQLPPRVTPR